MINVQVCLFVGKLYNIVYGKCSKIDSRLFYILLPESSLNLKSYINLRLILLRGIYPRALENVTHNYRCLANIFKKEVCL